MKPCSLFAPVAAALASGASTAEQSLRARPTAGASVALSPLPCRSRRKKFTMRSVLWALVAMLVLALIGGCTSNSPLRADSALDAVRDKKVLIVVTSHGQFGNLDRKTGYWLEEVTHFYYQLEKAGFDIDIASPKGGTPPVDERSTEPGDAINDAFLATNSAKTKLSQTIPLAKVNPDQYVVVYFAGGHGAMWDFPHNQDVARIASAIYTKGHVVAAVCHGPAALLNVKLADGTYLIANQQVTGFSNEEENLVFLSSDVPYSLENELERRSGGHYAQNFIPFTSHAVVSGRLVTGQNPASTDATAEAVIEVLRTLGRGTSGGEARSSL